MQILRQGAWWTADRMLDGGFELGQVHSAYLIPVAVGGIEAASAAGAAGWAPLALLCLGAGLLGWASFGSLTLARLLPRRPSPPPLLPTMAIDTAIAGAVGVASFNIYGPRPGGLAYAAAGYGLVMVGVQVRLLPRYLPGLFHTRGLGIRIRRSGHRHRRSALAAGRACWLALASLDGAGHGNCTGRLDSGADGLRCHRCPLRSTAPRPGRKPRSIPRSLGRSACLQKGQRSGS